MPIYTFQSQTKAEISDSVNVYFSSLALMTLASPAAHFPVSQASSWYLTTSECTTTTSKLPTTTHRIHPDAPVWSSQTSCYSSSQPQQMHQNEAVLLNKKVSPWSNLKHRHKRHLAWSLAFSCIVRLQGTTAGQRAPLSQDLGLGYAYFLSCRPCLLFTLQCLSTLPFFYCSANSVHSASLNSNLRTPQPAPSPTPPSAPHFIWIPQWGLFVWELPQHCAAKGSTVNGQANEFFSDSWPWCTQHV